MPRSWSFCSEENICRGQTFRGGLALVLHFCRASVVCHAASLSDLLSFNSPDFLR